MEYHNKIHKNVQKIASVKKKLTKKFGSVHQFQCSSIPSNATGIRMSKKKVTNSTLCWASEGLLISVEVIVAYFKEFACTKRRKPRKKSVFLTLMK
jgi:hypothetical protein